MKIENYREEDGAATGRSTNVLATFDIYLEKISMTLRNWKVVRKKDGGWFACPPSYKSTEGSYKPLVEIHTTKREGFNKMLYDLLKPLVHSLGDRQ